MSGEERCLRYDHKLRGIMVADVPVAELRVKQDCGVYTAGVDSVSVCSADAQIKCVCVCVCVCLRWAECLSISHFILRRHVPTARR